MDKSKFFGYAIDSSGIYLIYRGFALGLLQVSGPSPTITSPFSQIFTSFGNKFLCVF